MSLIIVPAASSILHDPVTIAEASNAILARNTATTITWSTKFVCAENRVCTGATFRAKSAVNETATFSLWNEAGTLLAQKATSAAAVNGTGNFSVTWDSQVAITGKAIYYVGVYVATLSYTYGGANASNAWIQALGALSNGRVWYDPRYNATAANTFPNSADSGSPSTRCTVRPDFV